MIRGILTFVVVGSIAGLCGCRSNGLSTASTSNPTPPLAKKSSPSDSRTFAQNSKSGPATKSTGFGKSKPADVRTADVKNAGLESRNSARVPTVQPAVHSGEPDPEIPGGEADAAQPQGNAITRFLQGQKEPAKRRPLPLAENSASQSTTDETFGGF